MEDPIRQDKRSMNLWMKHENLPPSPPETADNVSDPDTASVDNDIPLPPPSTEPTEVLAIDKNTPDSHVPRDPRLIRLTGVHPFNVEAPLSALFNEGFLTSPELFYVRNHGAVPQVQDEDVLDWEFSVGGYVLPVLISAFYSNDRSNSLVERPMSLTLRQLIAEYIQITCPVTLVCAGNRRKEQNVVRKSKGFSWGAAGVSTALFTGVLMGEVIKKARPRRGARYVCMEGADELVRSPYLPRAEVCLTCT